MLINFSTMVKNIFQNKYHLIFYLCSLLYFISSSIMSDYVSTVEPMDIKEEAVCAVVIQPVTAEGEKGAGVDIKRTYSHLEANNLLDLDKGELTNDLEKVIASTPNKFAKTAAEFKRKLTQLSIIQGKGALGEPTAEGGVQNVKGGNEPTGNRALPNNNDVFIEGVRVPGSSLVPYLLAPPFIHSLVLKQVRTMKVTPAIPVAPQPSSACTTTVCSVKGRGEVVTEIPPLVPLLWGQALRICIGRRGCGSNLLHDHF